MSEQTVGGASLRLQVTEILSSKPALERLREQLADVLSAGLSVSISLQNLGNARTAGMLFGSMCGVLSTIAAEADSRTENISLVVDASVLPPQLLWMRRREILGPGPLYLLANGTLIRPSADRAERRRQDRFWLQCWQLRSSGQVRTAISPMVSSVCPLLSPEIAEGVLPPVGLQVPPGTAWVCRRINLVEHAGPGGEIGTAALQDALKGCIDSGEALHDAMRWPTASMRHDAWLNRRLAIFIEGIGDLAARRRLDPRCFQSLKNLGAVLADIREWACAYSRQLAGDTEIPPAFNLSGSDAASGDTLAEAWRDRWQDALLYSATRHRNLIAMSPWSVFPTAAAADSRYSDLLPLLAYADACSFPPPPSLQRWNINEFRGFHNRAWAVLEQKDARQLVAEKV